MSFVLPPANKFDIFVAIAKTMMYATHAYMIYVWYTHMYAMHDTYMCYMIPYTYIYIYIHGNNHGINHSNNNVNDV